MWPRILLLTLGTFAIGTDGFIVAGILGAISTETHVSISTAGRLVTAFAVVYAISSPLIASLTATVPRRRLILGALLVFILGNAGAALATTYAGLLAARVVAALASAAFTPCASVAAATLAGPSHRGRALSLVLGGITMSTIVGVPLGAWIGGFRAAFWLVTGLGVAALLGLARLLPDLPPPPAVGLRDRLKALRTPGVPTTLTVTALAMAAGFTVYTYIGPLLTETLRADAGTVSLVLVVFGCAGTLGNGLSGWLADRWGARQTVTVSLVVVMGVLACLPTLADTLPGTLVAITLWNGAGWLLLPAQQLRLLSAAPHLGQILISLNASAMYPGIGSAGLLGGWIIDIWDVRALGPAAALILAVATILHGASSRGRVKARKPEAVA
ncbi:MFS transporter [Methylobacterium sp. J-048]|uniref:MFS transporter n=1 Tax=Methylobacterium sp. J-048 TaxID=2836635 RepID=UPI001FB888F6|nr:MFS transporter [Methylobacterium sp. J-048]MCJ2056645.1 MFS transporter [Methylobacterium sp. J-048]